MIALVGPAMTGDADFDLIDYMVWARDTKGLAITTLRVRWDLLHRLGYYLGGPLRDAQTGQLLAFEQVAIAGKAPETRRAYVCHLRAFYAWAHERQIVSSNPALLLTIPKTPRRLPRPIAEDDLAVAIRLARPKMAASLVLAAYAGLRCIEIAGLDWSDLHRHADGTATLHIRHAKGGDERVVEVGEAVLERLRGYGIKRRGPMFLGADGRQMSAASLSNIGNNYLRRLDLPYTMHQLRHRYGTVAYQLTRDIRLVQELLGHKSTSTTAVYTRPNPESAARMVAAMDELANPA